VAWGSGEESWSVDYSVHYGDPDIPEGQAGSPWTLLTDYLRKSWKHESGIDLQIQSTGIDSGGSNTKAVYDYVKRHKGSRVFALKGQSGENLPIISAPQRKRTGKSKRPVDLFIVGVDQAKGIVMKRLKISEQGAGYCHFPAERDVEYFRQLTSESLRTKYIKGFPKREWHKADKRRNEALDCRVYAFATYVLISPQLDKVAYRIKLQKEQLSNPPKPVDDDEVALPPKEKTINLMQNAKTKPMRPRRSTGFVNKWRQL
jgi:phage terminase large subunit GpA-like protein